MTPLLVYRLRHRRGNLYLVRESGGQADAPPPDYDLVATIEARTWLQSFLNYGTADRKRMLKELEGK